MHIIAMKHNLPFSNTLTTSLRHPATFTHSFRLSNHHTIELFSSSSLMYLHVFALLKTQLKAIVLIRIRMNFLTVQLIIKCLSMHF